MLRLPPTAWAWVFCATYALVGACAPAVNPANTSNSATNTTENRANTTTEADVSAIEQSAPAPKTVEVRTDLEAQSPSSQAPSSTDRTTVPGWLGIHMRQTDEGVVVANVLRGSPAASAGLQPGDRVLRIGSQTVAVTSDVSTFVQEQPVGTRVNLDVRRGKETRLLFATIVAKPEREEAMRADLVGREAPSISRLKTVQGTVVPAWTQLRGQVVVLYFWASWCVACRALSPTLNAWYEELAPAGVNILGITMDPYEEATSASQHLKFPTYSDESGDVTLSYQGTALPTLIVVDKASVVREVMAGLNFERLKQLEALVQQLSAEPKAL